jgi:2-oxoglutarate ferredoxin oxidoreductase subunit gamma
MLEGQNVVWSPSYGPEMRGGAAHCTVIVSPEPIGSPVVSQADAGLILDEPSLPKFEPKIRAGGMLIVNVSLVRQPPSRDDVRICDIPATALAERAGDVRTANMVMLGALQSLMAPVARESMSGAFRTICPADKGYLIPLNEAALDLGVAEVSRAAVRTGVAAPAAERRAGVATRRRR